jgi:hypothetical protein
MCRLHTAPFVGLVLAFTSWLAAAPLVCAQGGEKKGEKDSGSAQEENSSSQSVRTANEEELAELLDGFASAWKLKESAAVAAALERMTAFSNPELLAAVEDALAYAASKKDQADAKEEAKALGMADKGTIEKLCQVHVGAVVDAAARVAVAVGDEKSAELLAKALGAKNVSGNPLSIRAVVDALASHPHATTKADALVREILFSIDADDDAGDKFSFTVETTSVPGYDDWARYGAAVRYFGKRKTKDFTVVMYLAGMLRAPAPVHQDSPDNPPAAYWEARHRAWQRYVRDVVWALKEITGRTWKSGHDDEGGEAAAAEEFVRANRDALGLK